MSNNIYKVLIYYYKYFKIVFIKEFIKFSKAYPGNKPLTLKLINTIRAIKINTTL